MIPIPNNVIMIPVEIRDGKWTIAKKRYELWIIERTVGIATGYTLEQVREWAYADGGEPNLTFPTKQDAREYCAGYPSLSHATIQPRREK